MHSRVAPAAVHLHTSGPIPVTSLQCQGCTCGETLQPQECTSVAKAPTAACGPGFGPFSHHWPASLDSPAVSACCCAPTPCQPDSHHRPPLPYTCTWQDPEATGVHADNQEPQAAGHPQLALALTDCPGPPHYVCVGNRPLPLPRHLQLAPAAKYVHTTSSGHHCCLP